MMSQPIETNPSETARIVAFMRSLATKERDEWLRGSDHLANIFLQDKERSILRSCEVRQKVINEVMPKGVYGYITARTKHFDFIFKRALYEDYPQIVFLGAGYDSRPYQFQRFIKSTRIFELDVPSTQNRKRACLVKHQISIPESLAYVPINFNKESLKEVLYKSSYQNDQLTLFIWEGVSMYLDEASVDATLNFVKQNALPGSSIVMDYIYKDVIEDNSTYYGAEESLHSVSRFGEPYIFGIEKGKIAEFLVQRGFQVVAHHTPEDFERLYLSSGEGQLWQRAYGFFCNVHAVVT